MSSEGKKRITIDASMTVHPWSRASNPSVNASTLYELRTGPRSGKLLGSNVVDYEDIGGTSQRYVASEAPYHVDDYFRMVADTKARTLVSLTTEKDVYSKRKKYPVDVHHLEKGDKITFDATGIISKKGGTTVAYVDEKNLDSSYGGASPITIRRYRISKEGQPSHYVRHIIYRDWSDHGKPKNPEDVLALIEAVNRCQKADESVGNFPIVVNCGYGQGRTNAFIMMHQMASIMQQRMDELISPQAEPKLKLMAMILLNERLDQDPYKLNVERFIHASETRVIPFEADQPALLRIFPKQLMEAEIKKFARQHKLNAANPTLPAQDTHTDHAAKVRGEGHTTSHKR